MVGKIGSSEIPTDPMPIESQDLLIVMKDKDQWVTTKDREHMADLMSEKMNVIPGLNLSFEQPIQMRFNELIAGVKSDIAVKIYGDDLDQLFKSGKEVAALIGTIDGATDIKVEQVVGMPQLVVNYDRERVAQYGLNIADLNRCSIPRWPAEKQVWCMKGNAVSILWYAWRICAMRMPTR